MNNNNKGFKVFKIFTTIKNLLSDKHKCKDCKLLNLSLDKQISDNEIDPITGNLKSWWSIKLSFDNIFSLSNKVDMLTRSSTNRRVDDSIPFQRTAFSSLLNRNDIKWNNNNTWLIIILSTVISLIITITSIVILLHYIKKLFNKSDNKIDSNRRKVSFNDDIKSNDIIDTNQPIMSTKPPINTSNASFAYISEVSSDGTTTIRYFRETDSNSISSNNNTSILRKSSLIQPIPNNTSLFDSDDENVNIRHIDSSNNHIHNDHQIFSPNKKFKRNKKNRLNIKVDSNNNNTMDLLDDLISPGSITPRYVPIRVIKKHSPPQKTNKTLNTSYVMNLSNISTSNNMNTTAMSTNAFTAPKLFNDSFDSNDFALSPNKTNYNDEIELTNEYKSSPSISFKHEYHDNNTHDINNLYVYLSDYTSNDRLLTPDRKSISPLANRLDSKIGIAEKSNNSKRSKSIPGSYYRRESIISTSYNNNISDSKVDSKLINTPDKKQINSRSNSPVVKGNRSPLSPITISVNNNKINVSKFLLPNSPKSKDLFPYSPITTNHSIRLDSNVNNNERTRMEIDMKSPL